MFDGNHRSRRTVDYSGRARRVRGGTTVPLPSTASVVTGLSNHKHNLLESARIQRMERKEQQRREKATSAIQTTYRGWYTRHHVARLLVQHGQQPPPSSLLSSSLVLSMQLSLPLLPFLRKSSSSSPHPGGGGGGGGGTCQALLHYSDTNHATVTPAAATTTMSPLSHRRILQSALHELRPTQNKLLSTQKAHLLFQLVQNLLDTQPTTPAHDVPVLALPVLLELISCCQEWLWTNDSDVHMETNTTTNPKDSINYWDAATTKSNITKSLWQWSCRMASAVSTQEGFAVLAGTIFCAKTKLFRSKTTDASWFMNVLQEVLASDTDGRSTPTTNITTTNSTSNSHRVAAVPAAANNDPWYQTVLLSSLVKVLTTTGTATLLRQAASRMVDGRECILLSNALDIYNHSMVPPANKSALSLVLVDLVRVVLERRPDLAFLSSLVVRGEDNLQRFLAVEPDHPATATATDSTSNNGTDPDSMTMPMVESDDDDDDAVIFMGEVSVDTRNKRHKRTTSTKQYKSSRLTHQDLQTVSKLDRLYQEHVFRIRKDTFASLESSSKKKQQQDRHILVELSLTLAKPTLWADWTTTLFCQSSIRSTPLSSAAIPSANINAYVSLLYTMLQSTTGLRTATAVGVQSIFLSQLVFRRSLLEGLWNHTLLLVELQNNKETTTDSNGLLLLKTITVFCDLFAHHLLAVNDEEFLCSYTPYSNNSSRNSHALSVLPSSIVAQDVIARLRSVLYGLYWIKPVVATDVGLPYSRRQETDDPQHVSQHRARLLLSGTKLWNSLYERWCRLVRHQPFVDQSTWWFPHLMTQDDTGAVNEHISSDIGAADDDSVQSMDFDDDNDTNNDEQNSSQDNDHAPERTAAEQESDALAEAFKDPKMARILTCVPQALPFDRRVKLFGSLLYYDKNKTQDDAEDFQNMMRQMSQGQDGVLESSGRVRVKINRNELYFDSMSSLNKLGSKLKKKVQVTFINQHGAQEPGIDGGGVFKEFLDDLLKEAFYPDKNSGNDVPQLFTVTPLQTLAVNCSSNQFMLPHYAFLGRVLGKAVYESILVEPQFCLPFLNKLLGKQNTLDDLKNFDTEYYTNLIKLRNMDVKEIESLGITFELTTTIGDGANKTTRTIELIRGGSSIPVTKRNVIQYVHLVAHQRLNVDGGQEIRAFLRGFRDLIPASWVRLFSANELQKLISGDDAVQGIDVNGLKAIMQYSAGYHPSQKIIEWFWEVVEDMTPEQQRKLLKFVTSCSRQPLLGFQSLVPAPCVQQVRLSDSLFAPERANELRKMAPLPTSSTCMNLLKLPNYRDKQLLKRKLLDAVESGAGFELT